MRLSSTYPLLAAAAVALMQGGGAAPAAAAQDGSGAYEEIRRAVPADRGAPMAAPSGYRISPQDLLDIRVFQEAELSGPVRVGADGSIRLPHVGNIKISGKSPDAAAEAIATRLKGGYLVNPQVTVAVLAFARKSVSVLGQVSKPDFLELPSDKPMTLLQAIARVGGFTRIANTKKVILRRGERILEVNARDIARGEASDVVLKDGDIIQVNESIF
ncbi:MAG: polysaccharide biosynthesis/export family protein [Verrucomicrobiales bacterium]